MTRRRTPPRRRAALALLLSLAALAIPARAGGEETPTVGLSGESRGTALRLDEARKRLDEKKWPEAVELLQAILTTAGDDLVPVNPAHSVQARRLCQIHLASLPADALRLYRRRHETQARKRLEQARAERDDPPLRKLVEEAFCTRAAERAIDLLGDRAFERGRFAEAEEWWRLLAPLPDPLRDPRTRDLTLVYPDPTDPARAQAKQLLARLFRGPGPGWADDLAAFRTRHGKAEGSLAGHTGRYADRLQALADERRKEHPPADRDWPTFGGSTDRGRVVPAAEDVLDRLADLCRDGPTWRFNLAERGRQEGEAPPPAGNAAQARSLAFHPVIVGDQVLLADARYVTAYDLRTGQSREWYDAAKENGGVKPNLKLPAPPDLRYTLTAADGDVYVRLGAQDVGKEGATAGNPGRDTETFLACLSLRPDREGGHFRWAVRGDVHANAFFEGAPLVADGQLWIASSRYDTKGCVTSIHCYPADDTGAPPPRWRRDVCQTSDVKAGEPRYRHHLLTLAGTQLVYCSHAGAVVAVDAWTGRTNWGVRYPRRDERDDDTPPGGPSHRDLAPVLAAEGRLYVAPADSDRLLCLDPATGRTLWEREAMRVVHLLGVGQGKLIFATRDGLRAVGAADGTDASGWVCPQAGSLVPGGRGLLIGDLVLFPTVQKRDEFSSETTVYAIRQRDGMPADDPARLYRLPAGNLAYANGCLAVADRHTLSVFVSPRLLLDRRRAEVKRRPDSVPALLNMGRAEADAGHLDQAARTFGRAEARARELPKSQRRLLREAVAGRQRVLIETGRRAAATERWEGAAEAFHEAAAGSLPPRARLRALARAAQIWEDAGRADRAVAVWETIRADEVLRPLQVIDSHGAPASAASAAAVSLARLRGRPPPAHPASPPRPADPPSAVPSLPLFRAWHVKLEADEWVLDGWRQVDPELLLTGSPDGRFYCRLTSTGEVRWRQTLPFAPVWAGSHGDLILVGGERGAACLRRDDGEFVWHCAAFASGSHPSAPLPGFRVVEDPQAPEPFTDFRLVGGRLFFLQGRRRLFALNAATGDVLWDRRAPDAAFRLPYPHGFFSPFYHVGAQTVLVQSPGRRWLLDAATGRTIHEAPDGPDLWSRPPLPVDERTLAVVTDRRHVVLVDAPSGRCLWTHSLRAGSTLSGEPPLIVGRGELLLLVTPLNIGHSLQRLDRATGKPLWPRSRLLTMKTLDASAWAFDSDAVYFEEDGALVARSAADGGVLWRRALGRSGGRQVRRLGDCLAVHDIPSPADARFWFRSPLGSVQWWLGPSLRPESVFAVRCCDAKSGREVQRLNFRLEAPARTAWRRRITPEGDLSSGAVRTSPLLASADGPVVRLASPRPFVAVGGEVWGLKGN